ncbi:MAG TPA: heme-binding protein [Casimicrobiaceae bacterium]|nr:heme-binding protein [Casimicrobiaceae bacterium]
MTRLTLELALRVIAGAFAKAADIGCVPLTVVVLDAGGHEVAVQRQDRSGILRVEIARAKAWGALGMGYASREIAERAQKAPAFVGALASVSQGRVVPAAGGVLLHDEERNLIGAVGISGDTSDRDEECALAGVAAAGLKP